MATALAASSSLGGTAAVRKRVAVADTDDLARFTEDATREVYLVKVPVDVINVWRTRFEAGGTEVTRNTGERDLVPEVELGTVLDSSDSSGKLFEMEDENGNLKHYRLSLRPASGMRQRIISAEVGPRGQNVKFEGVVSQSGQLMPVAADSSYRELMKLRVEAAEAKAQLKNIGQKEELQALRKTGGVVIRAAAQEESATSKKRKAKDETAEPGAGPAAKKKKPVKKKERDLSREAVREALLKCFEKIDPETGQVKKYWKKKELRKTTGLQLHIMTPVLNEICVYHEGGPHDKTYSLKLV